MCTHRRLLYPDAPSTHFFKSSSGRLAHNSRELHVLVAATRNQPRATHTTFLLRIFPPVSVFEPHHIVQLRRRHFEDVAVDDRGHAVHRLRRDVH